MVSDKSFLISRVGVSVVPISSMIIGYGIVEFIGNKRWKKDEF